MAWLMDTNIAIHLRDNDVPITKRIGLLPVLPRLSMVSRIELEGGVYAKPALTTARRHSLDLLLDALTILDFDRPMADGYRDIVAHCGYSRSRALDRMIAATAIVENLTLITLNGQDFSDIPGLKLEAW